MMPHPDRISQKFKFKNKLLHKRKLYADGYKIFKNAYNYFK